MVVRPMPHLRLCRASNTRDKVAGVASV